MKRLLVALLASTVASGALAQGAALPANEFMASPSGTTGFLAPRVIALSDISSLLTFSNLTGSLTCGQHPALTGAVTSSAGSCSTNVGTINFSSLTGSAACGQLPALTGDITSSSCATTLATVTVPKGGTGQVTFTANLPILGNGTSALSQGTVSGNTTKFTTATGSLPSGDFAKFDANGNIVDGGAGVVTWPTLGDTGSATNPTAGM